MSIVCFLFKIRTTLHGYEWKTKIKFRFSIISFIWTGKENNEASSPYKSADSNHCGFLKSTLYVIQNVPNLDLLVLHPQHNHCVFHAISILLLLVQTCSFALIAVFKFCSTHTVKVSKLMQCRQLKMHLHISGFWKSTLILF